MKPMPTADRATTLADLKAGQSGTVKGLTGDGPLRLRLLEMGLVPGTNVSVRRRAPLGDPMELDVRGYSLSIRKSEALQILLGSHGD